jgi:hypothetical protein
LLTAPADVASKQQAPAGKRSALKLADDRFSGLFFTAP